MDGQPRDKLEGKARDEIVRLTARIVESFVGNNRIERAEIPDLISSIQNALCSGAESVVEEKPAVDIRKSVFYEHIVCLECGLKFQTLRAHLRTKHGLTPEEYREKWRLNHNYPFVAQRYSELRCELAKNQDFGHARKRKQDR